MFLEGFMLAVSQRINKKFIRWEKEKRHGDMKTNDTISSLKQFTVVEEKRGTERLEKIICKLAQRDLQMGNTQDRLIDKGEYVVSSKV